MPLDKIERDVLEVICEEHRQTHRGAKAMIVHVGMNAKTGGQKALISQALQALYMLGLVARRDDSWLPTLEGKAALDVSASDSPSWIGFDTAQAGGDETVYCEVDSNKGAPDLQTKMFTKEEVCKIFDVPAHLVEDIQDRTFSEIEINQAKEGLAKESANEMMRFLLGTDRISDDLLNRCAAMTATLLAQAEQAYAGGELEAWRDLHWLMETGKQLVAMRGGS